MNSKPPIESDDETGGEPDERGYFSEHPSPTPQANPSRAKPGLGKAAHYHGHRDRLRERFRESGDRALADYELLELLLFSLIPRRDTKPIAKALLERFGSLPEIFGAPIERLMEVSGIGEIVATDLKLIGTISHRMLKS